MSEHNQAIMSDYARMQPGRPYSQLRLLDACMTNPGLLASVLFRIQHSVFKRGWIRFASIIRVINNSLTGADILPGTTIGNGLLLPHPTGVVIGHGVIMGHDCTVLQNVTIGEKFADGKPPHNYPAIGDRVVIGAGAAVLGDVNIGDDVTIAANAVVLHDIPRGCVAAGCPAKIIRDSSISREI